MDGQQKSVLQGVPAEFILKTTFLVPPRRGEAVDSNSKPTVKRHRSVNPTLVLPRHRPDRRRHLQNDIAIAVHTLPHRSVSLGLVAKALGAMPRAGRKKTNTGKVLEVAATSKVTSSSV